MGYSICASPCSKPWDNPILLTYHGWSQWSTPMVRQASFLGAGPLLCNWNLSMTCCSILYIATKCSGNCPDWWLVQANDSFLMHLRYWLLSYTRSVTNCMMPPKGPRMAKVSRRIRESVIVEAKGWLWNEGFDGCFLWNILRWSHEIVTDPFASLLRIGNRDQKRPSAILHSSTSFMYSINHPAVFSSMLRRLVGHWSHVGRYVVDYVVL